MKISIENDIDADHVMQHPIHLHGQRFVVLSRGGKINENMAWKDTVLVVPGEIIEILVDMSNLGVWMSHCHISEHLHADMMLSFRVQDESGYATGDEYRSTVEPSADAQQKSATSRSASTKYLFNTPVADTDYHVTIESKRFVAGKKQEITLSFYDANDESVPLSSLVENPLTLTLVRSDNREHVFTYPGSTDFDFIVEEHGDDEHNNSDNHHDEPVHDSCAAGFTYR